MRQIKRLSFGLKGFLFLAFPFDFPILLSIVVPIRQHESIQLLMISLKTSGQRFYCGVDNYITVKYMIDDISRSYEQNAFYFVNAVLVAWVTIFYRIAKT